MIDRRPEPRPLLLCLDMEADSETLCRLAWQRAQRCSQPLHVLHVLQADGDEAEARGRLKELLTRCGASAETVSIVAGVPEVVIPQVAERSRAAPLVLGRRHRPTVERIYVGSTTSAVISQARVPVLVIPLHGED